jgi:hypothetical protein
VPDQADAEVQLRPGSNRLVFKVAYGRAGEVMYARLVDSGRKLRYAEHSAGR